MNEKLMKLSIDDFYENRMTSMVLPMTISSIGLFFISFAKEKKRRQFSFHHFFQQKIDFAIYMIITEKLICN